MSISPQELLRKISTDSHSSSEKSRKGERPEDKFRELMRVSPVTEGLREKDVFSMIAEEEECKESPILAAEIPYSTPLMAANAVAADAALASSSVTLSAAIEAVFEKMASCMIVMTTSHETETTLLLDNPQFASSALFGTQITIREFSTAPKAFNIEIISNPAAVAMIEGSKNALLSAFQKGDFNFTVHRLETHFQSEDRPVFHRKESNDREHQDQAGGRRQ